MQRSDLTDKEYNSLIEKIVPILIEKGLKSTTMDIVSSYLGMSKRTLYEIFGSKSEMLKAIFTNIGKKNQEYVIQTFASSNNVMEAFITIFKFHRDSLRSLNVDFFKDMDRLYKDEREYYVHTRESRCEGMIKMFELGVKQGMFRPDVDFAIQSRIMGIQMESLKRMEEYFPKDIDLIRVYDAIIVGFLRSIASPEGMKILDQLTVELTKPK